MEHFRRKIESMDEEDDLFAKLTIELADALVAFKAAQSVTNPTNTTLGNIAQDLEWFGKTPKLWAERFKNSSDAEILDVITKYKLDNPESDGTSPDVVTLKTMRMMMRGE